MTGAPPVGLRLMRLEDVPLLLELNAASFPAIPPERRWQPEMLEAHILTFGDGQAVAVAGGRVVGSATSLRVPLSRALRQHRWREITGYGMITTHDPGGNALYGTEIMVHPDFRRRGIARRLYQARKDYIIRNGLKAFVTGGRIPGYELHAKELTAMEYVAHVIAGELEDRTLTPQLRSGLFVAGILDNYLLDERSHNYATLLLWRPRRDELPGRARLDEAALEA